MYLIQIMTPGEDRDGYPCHSTEDEGVVSTREIAEALCKQENVKALKLFRDDIDVQIASINEAIERGRKTIGNLQRLLDDPSMENVHSVLRSSLSTEESSVKNLEYQLRHLNFKKGLSDYDLFAQYVPKWVFDNYQTLPNIDHRLEVSPSA